MREILNRPSAAGSPRHAAPAGRGRGARQTVHAAGEESHRGGREGLRVLHSHSGQTGQHIVGDNFDRTSKIKYLQNFDNYSLQFEPLQEYKQR